MARFGDNLRAIRNSLGLSQMALAEQLQIGQPRMSDLERMEWAPTPQSVMKLAEGLARLTGQAVEAEFDRLLEGVSSRMDAVQAKRASDQDPIERLRQIIAQIPADKRADLVAVLERLAIEEVKVLKRGG